jgi:hypothetical protein
LWGFLNIFFLWEVVITTQGTKIISGYLLFIASFSPAPSTARPFFLEKWFSLAQMSRLPASPSSCRGITSFLYTHLFLWNAGFRVYFELPAAL